MTNILIVDDESSILQLFQLSLQKQNYQVDTVKSGLEAIAKIKNSFFDLIVTDLSMPGMDGIELLRRVKELSPETMVVLMTAYGTTKTAVEAIKLGAYDYLTKPVSLDDLQKTIQNAISKAELQRENEALKKVNYKNQKSLIGISDQFNKMIQWVDQVAKTSSSVLILGESGTGKELVSREIHSRSDRASHPFVAVNCAAIPQHLIESELFGYAKGAFTGAEQHRIGFFEAAHRGTIFLDEIGELPLGLQSKLLRVLAERKVIRLGSTREISIDIRVISATNQLLEKQIEMGQFREDLFYRLNVLQTKLSPLRERREDIPILAEHFLKKYSDVYKKGITGIDEEALEALKQYDFPGNIRELVNVVEQCVVLEDEKTIQLETLPEKIREQRKKSHRVAMRSDSGDINLETQVDSYERELIERALSMANGVKTQAAKILNISFRSLRYRLRKLNMDDET